MINIYLIQLPSFRSICKAVLKAALGIAAAYAIFVAIGFALVASVHSHHSQPANRIVELGAVTEDGRFIARYAGDDTFSVVDEADYNRAAERLFH